MDPDPPGEGETTAEPIIILDQDFDHEDSPMSPKRKRLNEELDRD